MAIKSVAVVGASGNLGSEITLALLEAGFAVTAITRPSSTATFPPNVAVRRADPTSFDQLRSALAGQDAVVSASPTNVVAYGAQEALVDAAVAAGVRRFVPGEFGHSLGRLDRFPEEGATLRRMLGGKALTVEYAVGKAEANPGFTWTGVGNSMFFDWGLDTGILGIQVKDRKATIHDSGDEIFSTCTLAFIGKAVAAVLQHEEETKNKFVEVVQFQTSQNAVVEALEEVTGEKFALTHVKTSDVEEEGREKIATGAGEGAFVDFLHLWAFADGGNHAVPESETANKLLGLPAPQKGVRDAVREYVQRRGV